MQALHRRCWTLRGAKAQKKDLPVREVEDGRSIEVSRLSPGRGILIVKGKAKLVKESGSEEVVLGELQEGDMVGTINENVPAKSHTQLIFQGPSHISPVTWEMVERDILPLLEEFEFETKGLFKKGSFKLHPAEYMHPDPIVRTARFIWKIFELNSDRKVPGKVLVEPELTRMSQVLFMTEGESALAMGHLMSDGIISFKGSGIQVDDKTALEKHCIWHSK